MESFTFNVDRLDVHNQKAATDHSDSDWISFFAVVSNLDTKKAVPFQLQSYHIGNIIHSGDSINGPFSAGPITLGEREVVTLSYVVTNLGSSRTEDEFAQSVKVAAHVTGEIATIAETVFSTITTGDPSAGIAVGKKISSAIDTVIGALSDLFDFLGIHIAAANCNGVVLSEPGITFNLNELRAAVNQAASREYEGPQTNSRCGQAPHTRVNFSVGAFPTADFSAFRYIGNPVMIQSSFGLKGNFELLVALATGGLAAFFRANDGNGVPWGGPVIFGTELGRIDALSMIQSNFGGNLEVVARVGDRLKFFFRDGLTWKGPFPLSVNGVEVTGVTGNPVLIQSNFGQKGNFELVVPLVNGGLGAFFRLNDEPGVPWGGPAVFGTSRYASVTMIQSNFGVPGTLEVLANVGTGLDFFFRPSADLTWTGPFGMDVPFVTSNPVLIQGHFGAKGNFEGVAPTVSLGVPPGNPIVHFFRKNDDPDLPWGVSTEFGAGFSNTDRIEALTMIQSNFGSPGNLEVIVRVGERLAFAFRDSGPNLTWNGPFML